jgi:RHS repeat-associated protein
MGNKTQEVEGAVTTNYAYSNMMRPLSKIEGGVSTSFGYDRNGNLTSKTEGNSSYSYVWDYDNRLKEVRQNGNLLFSYTYDPNGRRVRSLNSGTGVTTTYVYAGINVIYEATLTESTDYLYANGMRIAKKTGATVKYFHSDHLGSTRLVTDSSGQPTFESDYKPFGEEANATGTEKYTFTGQFIEADIGLYYFGARWYDASLGRFISEDPIKGSMTSSQSQNPYVYCMNNPLRYIDPTGMMGDIPDWSLPENYFDGYVNSVGSLINTVVNTATEFAAGVNCGVAAGTTSASGSAGVPSPGTTYSPSSEPGYGSGGQEYWDNGDINLSNRPSEYLSEWGVELSFVIVSASLYGTHKVTTGEWRYYLGTEVGSVAVGANAYAIQTPYKNYSDYEKCSALVDVTVASPVVGAKVRYYEGEGVVAGYAVGWSPIEYYIPSLGAGNTVKDVTPWVQENWSRLKRVFR